MILQAHIRRENERLEAELLYDALVADADGSAQASFGLGLGPRVRLRV